MPNMIQSRPLLSIAIPTYNRIPYLKDLLGLLLPQIATTEPNDVELIISNNASTDGTDEFCRGLKLAQLRYWENKTNIGGDRNFLKCIREAKGEYIWLIGDDDLVHHGAVKQVLEILKINKPGLLIAAENDKKEISSYPDYRGCIEKEISTKGEFAINHTLISANIFRRELFDLDFAESKLRLNYAHMFGLMCRLGGNPVVVCPALISERPVRADFAKYPSFLCIKHAIYLRYLAKTFGVSRFNRVAVKSACNLPMEFGSRIKHHLLKARAHLRLAKRISR